MNSQESLHHSLYSPPSSYIELPDWKNCENDTPFFRINLDKFYRKMQDSVEQFRILRPTIDKIVANLDDLDKNLNELNLQISELQKPIFQFNAKPADLQKSNSWRKHHNSGTTKTTFNPPKLPEKPESSQSLKINSQSSTPNISPKRHTTKPFPKNRNRTATIGGMSSFLKHELIDGSTEYLTHILFPLRQLRGSLFHFSKGIGNITSDHFSNNETYYKKYQQHKKEY